MQETAAALINAFATAPIDYCKCLHVSLNVASEGSGYFKELHCYRKRELITAHVKNDPSAPLSPRFTSAGPTLVSDSIPASC